MARAGDLVGRYRLEHVLGRGGMGEVWAARDEELARRVAVKLVVPRTGADPREFSQRVGREARAAARLNHPNAVAVYDVGEHEGSPFVVMELVEGTTLRARIGDATPLAERVRWLADIARALGAAHVQGLVHRDVKPDNVMVRRDGVVKVLDFGIARAAALVDASAPTADVDLGTVTHDGAVVGTPLYMAPEQLRREPLDGRADQYAWGIMAYEVLSGAPPWPTGDAVHLIAAALGEQPKRLSPTTGALPAQAIDAVMRALEKAPDARHATMDDAARAVEGAAPTREPPVDRGAAAPSSSATSAAVTAVGPPGPAPSRGRRPPRWAIPAAIAIACALVAVLAWRRFAASRAAFPVSTASAPSSSAKARAPDHRCGHPRPEEIAADPRCPEPSTIAWCTPSETLQLCCADGLVPSLAGGACVCPKGGVSPRLASLPCEKVPSRGVPPEKIQAIVRGHMREFGACYRSGLDGNAALYGNVAVRFTIDPYGRVEAARVQGSSLPDEAVQLCIVAAMEAIVLPPPPDGEPIPIIYPINFDPGH